MNNTGITLTHREDSVSYGNWLWWYVSGHWSEAVRHRIYTDLHMPLFHSLYSVGSPAHQLHSAIPRMTHEQER